ncbi:hypothetical protein K6U70_07495 [Vibrio vulnificus]|uniref:hypothetical protein n=1 Tax=Vibrio vulnificus TaxID=672 RepID=UPI001EEA35A8|nr:hypothetical protein [Vibrio vulnificus]MCG6272035.1 hypothetical protein [Vibrio vulnificus]
MKYLSFALIMLSSNVFAETLTTDNFTIQIERECEEGMVTCDKIKFIYSPVGFETKQTVKGKTVHTKCADGITPCAFQGSEFVADGAKYFIHNSGVLEILDKNGNQLLVEQGKWQY